MKLVFKIQLEKKKNAKVERVIMVQEAQPQ